PRSNSYKLMPKRLRCRSSLDQPRLRTFTKLLFENVVDALAELTPQQRLAFLLRHYEGMSYEEIAGAMKCSTGTVKKGVSRAIVKLRAKLSPDSDRPEALTNLANEYLGEY